MAHDDRTPLEVLKFELEFLQAGGYGRSPRDPQRSPLIFEDSLSCINLGCKTDRVPCRDCLMMQFVPAARRSEAIPCRHIPLNEAGETVESFYQRRDQQDLEEALNAWLRATIRRLEAETARSSGQEV
jgi:hypothetical protein